MGNEVVERDQKRCVSKPPQRKWQHERTSKTPPKFRRTGDCEVRNALLCVRCELVPTLLTSQMS